MWLSCFGRRRRNKKDQKDNTKEEAVVEEEAEKQETAAIETTEPHEIPPRTATLLVTPKVHVGTRIAEVRRSKSKQQLLDQEEEEAENPHNDPKRGEDDPVTTPPSNPTSPKMAGMKAIFAINQQDELRKAFAKRLGKTTAEREETTENEKKSEQKIVEEADKSTINELSANQSRDNVKQEGNTPPPIPARPPRRKDQ